MEPEDAGFLEHPARARRAKALGALSILVVAVACIAYARPSFSLDAAPAPPLTHPAATSYQIAAVDFVTPTIGWVLVDLDTSEFTVLGTANAGRTWKEELTSASARPSEYMRFFNRTSGVIVALGAYATVFGTSDGGATWTVRPLGTPDYVTSASFVDATHGWVLAYAPGDGGLGPTNLFATTDGGVTWRKLGRPAGGIAQAYAVTFADQTHGWLDAVASGPYAYSTSDAGATWRPDALPAPASGWPVPRGAYFVAARPTLGGGVIVTVVNSAPIHGRNGAGTAVLSFPPLTVRTFDGGSPVEYVYSTLVDSATNGMLHVAGTNNRPGPVTFQAQPANQIGFSSADGGATWSTFSTPAPGGTIGYADATSWWWLGSGVAAQTADGGRTWSPVQPDPVAQPLPGSLIVLDSGHAWISALGAEGPVLFTTSDGGHRWDEVRLPPLTAS